MHLCKVTVNALLVHCLLLFGGWTVVWGMDCVYFEPQFWGLTDSPREDC